MKANSAIMEADSTTIENDCYEFYDASEVERESSLMDDLLKYHGFFHRVVSPLLKSGQVPELLEWMKETNLIPPSVKCSNDLPGCGLTTWTPTRVVDKFQWQCNSCKQKLPIRENSFFKNLFCSLGICFKVILAWCQDIDFANVAVALGIKKQLVNYIYEKIERVVSSSSHSPGQFGGPGSVVLVELYPDSIGDLHSTFDTSKSDTSPKPHTKILCIADTKQVPVRYWLHAVTGNVLVQTENNNTKLKKISLCDEVLGVLEKLVLPGGYCAVGGGVHYTALLESLQASGIFEGVKSFSDLSSQTNGEVRSFIMCDIWKSAAILCEAAQDLPRNKMQSYLTCCAWRREVEPRDTFQCLIQLIAEYDHSIAPKKSYKKKK